MRKMSGIYRCGLLILLTFGVMLMHHAPGLHDQAHEISPPAASVAQAHHHPAPPPAGAHGHTAMSGMAAEAGNEPSDSSAHAMLHLCLAIMAGVAVLLLAGATGTVRLRLPRAIPGKRAGPHRLRRCLPVPRRLAVLCVLRL